MQRTKQQTIARWGFYLLGMVLLALGLTLNTKTGLGASAIVSVPFTVSQATGWNFGDLTLVVAIIFTGIGAAMTVAMQLIPNPGDGIVGTIACITGKELGFCKNCFDLGCVSLSLIIGLCFGNVLLGVGLGTLISMVGVGRAIAGFNYLCKRPLLEITGMN